MDFSFSFGLRRIFDLLRSFSSFAFCIFGFFDHSISGRLSGISVTAPLFLGRARLSLGCCCCIIRKKGPRDRWSGGIDRSIEF
jgi:hypothetical protein